MLITHMFAICISKQIKLFSANFDRYLYDLKKYFSIRLLKVLIFVRL